MRLKSFDCSRSSELALASARRVVHGCRHGPSVKVQPRKRSLVLTPSTGDAPVLRRRLAVAELGPAPHEGPLVASPGRLSAKEYGESEALSWNITI